MTLRMQIPARYLQQGEPLKVIALRGIFLAALCGKMEAE